MEIDKSHAEAEKEKKASIKHTCIFKGKIFELHRDILTFQDGKTKQFDIVSHPGAVAIIPIDQNEKIILVKQWRRAVQKILIEIPAGTLNPHETPEKCADRELQEEIGYKGSLSFLGEFFSSPGFTNEYLYLFLAKDLKESREIAEDTQGIDLLRASPQEVMEMIAKRKIVDAKTICGMYYYFYLKNHVQF